MLTIQEINNALEKAKTSQEVYALRQGVLLASEMNKGCAITGTIANIFLHAGNMRYCIERFALDDAKHWNEQINEECKSMQAQLDWLETALSNDWSKPQD